METILNNWLIEVKKDLIDNYHRLGLKASGAWEKSLEEYAEISLTRIRAGIMGADYSYYLENGRGPSRKKGTGSGKSLKEIIREWIDIKGITPDKISKDSLAFLIARKIHKYGIKVPNKHNAGGLISDIITKERVKELNEQLILFYIDSFKSEIIKTI